MRTHPQLAPVLLALLLGTQGLVFASCGSGPDSPGQSDTGPIETDGDVGAGGDADGGGPDGADASDGGDSTDVDAGGEPDCEEPAVLCGEGCCEPPARCVEGVCIPCERQCEGRECGDDGCGGDCGPCDPSDECDESFQCVPRCEESTDALCKRLKIACGRVQAVDLCEHPRDVECPDTCGVDSRCADQANHCECVSEEDESFCARRGKDCGIYQARDNCGLPRAVDCETESAPCLAPDLCQNNLCTGPEVPPSNGGCETAEELALVDGRLEFDIDTHLAGAARHGSCKSGSGPEVVYALYLEELSRVQVTATPFGEAPATPVLYAASACEPRTSVTELACAVAPGSASPAELLIAEAGPGIVYLWIDATGPTTGGLQHIAIEAEPLLRHPLDSCTPPSGPIEGTLTLPLEMTLEHATPSDRPTACALSGRDIYVPILLNFSSGLVATIYSDTRDFHPVLSLVDSCDPLEAELACNDVDEWDYDYTFNRYYSVMEFIFPELQSGTPYWLRVGSTNGKSAHLELTLQFVPTVTNDTCVDAEIIEFSAPEYTTRIEQDTRAAQNNGVGRCIGPGADGGDLVYAITIPEGSPRHLTIDLEANDGAPYASPFHSYKPGLFLRHGCDAIEDYPLTCYYAASSAERLHIIAYSLQPGETYYLFVDTSHRNNSNGAGAFALTLSMPELPPPPENDRCAPDQMAKLLPDPVTHHGVLEGTTLGASNDLEPPCGFSTHGAEVLYQLDVERPSFLRVRATPSAESAGFSPILYILENNCEELSLRSDPSCARSPGTALPFTELMAELPVGRYFLGVDSATVAEGDFELDYYLFPTIQNSSCGQAPLLELSHEHLTLYTDTTRGGSSQQATCASSTLRELVWELAIPVGPPQDLLIAAAPTHHSRFVPVISVRSNCQDPTKENEYACETVGVPTQVSTVAYKLMGGAHYYLFVDGNMAKTEGSQLGANGPMELTLLLRDTALPTQGENCTEPIAFEVSIGSTTNLTGDPRSALDDYSARCTPDSVGGDLVYFTNLSEPMNLRISLTHAGAPLYAPIFWTRTSCDGPDLGCYYADVGETSVLNLRGIEGPLYIFVDSRGHYYESPYLLAIKATNPTAPLPEDTCEGPIALTLGPAPSFLSRATVEESTTGANHDYKGSCSSNAFNHSGADVVYKVYVPDRSLLTARVRREGGLASFKPAVYIREPNACTSSSVHDEIGCGNDSNGIAVASGYVEGGHDYYVIVDGTGNDGGTFALELSTIPVSVPVPDSCSSADDLALESTFTAERFADTSLGSNTSQPAISGTGNGPDLVYSFTLTQPWRFKASLLFASTAGKAILSLIRTQCVAEQSSDLLLLSNVDKGGPAMLELNLDPGTYYLWVDSVRPLQGEFRLEASIAAPAPSGSANCAAVASAQPVVFAGNSAVLQGSTFGRPHDTTGTSECGGATLLGGEALYKVVPPAGKKYSLRAKVERAAGVRASFVPYVYIRSDCLVIPSQVSCTSAGIAATPFSEGRTWYVYVDGSGADSDDFTLTLELVELTWDTCNDAGFIELDGTGHTTLTGTTMGYTNARDVNCTSPQSGLTVAGVPQAGAAGLAGQLPARDAVYKLRVPTAENDLHVNLAMQNTTSALMIERLASEESCPQQTDAPLSFLCDRRTTSSGLAYVKWESIPVGTYLIWIDAAYQSDAGPYTLDVDLVAHGEPAPAPLRDICATATPVQLDARGRATFTGSNRNGIAGPYHTSCNTNTGKAVAYTIPVPSGHGSTVVATLVPDTNSTSAKLNVELRSTCGPVPVSIACTNYTASAGGNPVSISTHIAPGQTTPLYLWVDSATASGAEGSYTAYVSVIPDTTPAPATCDDAVPLPPFSAEGKSFIQGALYGTSSFSGTCAAPGAERIHSVTLADAASLSLVAYGSASLSSTTASVFTPIVYIRAASCGGTNELRCALGGAGAKTRLSTPVLQPDTYWIFVDSSLTTATQAKSAGYTLLVERAMGQVAANDSCSGTIEAIALSEANNWRKSLTVTEALERSTADMTGSCASSGRDLVYSIALPAEHALSVTVTPLVTSPTSLFKPTIYLRTICADPQSELPGLCKAATAVSAAVTLETSSRAAQTYYLIVDSQGVDDSGPFRLDVAAPPFLRPDANDRCPANGAPFPPESTLVFSNMRASIGGSLERDGNDTTGTCGDFTGPDAVYKFNLPMTFDVTVRVSAIDFNPSIYLRSPCDAPGEVFRSACIKGSGSTKTSEIAVRNLPRGDYYVWVDSLATDLVGTFWLDVTLGEALSPIEPGGCASTITEIPYEPEHPDTPVTMEQVKVTKDYWGDGDSGSCLPDMAGPDYVYKLALEAEHQVTLYTGSGPYIYIRKESCGATSLANAYGCQAGSSKGTSAFVHRKMPAGVYYIFVDYKDAIPAGSAPSFTLNVELASPAEDVPVNDRCDGAIALASTSISGDIRLGSNDYAFGSSATCTRGVDFSKGRDLVYKHTTSSSATSFKVTVTKTGTTAWTSAVWIGSDCEALSSCIADGTSSSSAVLTVSAPLANHTYYVFVDTTVATSGGAFDIKVENL